MRTSLPFEPWSSSLNQEGKVCHKFYEEKSVNFFLLKFLIRQDVAYGVVTLLVNLTNSYEKQEIMPELIELAKFAKHHIPQDHELDDPDFVDKRIWVI